MGNGCFYLGILKGVPLISWDNYDNSHKLKKKVCSLKHFKAVVDAQSEINLL